MKDEVTAAIGGVFETMSFCQLCVCDHGPIELPAVAASMELSGAVRGEFRLAISTCTAARLMADFLGFETVESDSDRMESLVMEFANVACGAVLSAVAPGADIDFSIPRPSGDFLNCIEPKYYFSTTGGIPDIVLSLRMSDNRDAGTSSPGLS